MRSAAPAHGARTAPLRRCRRLKSARCRADASLPPAPQTCDEARARSRDALCSVCLTRCRTTQAVAQARAAFRAVRAAAASSPLALHRLSVTLPLPIPGDSSRAVALADDFLFPGGQQQRFRALQPCVDALLDGFGPSFKGMVDGPADGVGIWSLGDDATAISFVSNATVPALLRLVNGDFGARPAQAGHTVVAVNPSWTVSSDVGNFWEVGLRAKAKPVLEGTAWEAFYVALPLRRAGGATALLLRAWPGPWRLLALPQGDVIATWQTQPADAELARELAKRPER